MTTMLSYLVETARVDPNRPLFDTPGAKWTYGDVVRLVFCGSRELERLGVRRGERVVCLADDTISLALFFLSAGVNGVLPLPISPQFSEEYVKDLTRQSGARFVYTTPADLKRVLTLGRAVLCCRCDEKMIRSAPEGVSITPFPWEAEGVDLNMALDRLMAPINDINPRSSFLLQPTSGSTGKPKLVVRHHHAFARYANFVGDQVLEVLGKQRHRVALINQFTHAFACHMFTMGLKLGAEFFIPSALDTTCPLDEILEADPNVVTLTPRVLRSLAKQRNNMGRPSIFGPSARVLLSAGGAADPNLLEELIPSGIVPIEFYGSSEASIVSCTPARGWRRSCAGKVVGDAEVKISKRGEILVKSPGNMIGYFGDDELTNLVIDDDGFLRTGDMGRLERDGHLYILGRLRDVFNTPEGSNIYPERIELHLESLDEISQALLVGDGRPYVTAHIVVRDAPGTGFLDPLQHRALYDRIGEKVSTINAENEAIERIVAIALYGTPFEPTIYQQVNVGKVRRDRPAFIAAHRERIELLYDASVPKDSPMLVVPKERRYRGGRPAPRTPSGTG